MVDIDAAEIRKMKTPIHLPIVADAGRILQELKVQAGGVHGELEPWVQRCQEWKARYPLVLPEHRNDAQPLEHVPFLRGAERRDLRLAMSLRPGSSGFAIEIFLLCLKIKQDQRCFHNRGTGSMGFALPAAIGAAVASGRRTDLRRWRWRLPDEHPGAGHC